jgi:hypothetical protein
MRCLDSFVPLLLGRLPPRPEQQNVGVSSYRPTASFHSAAAASVVTALGRKPSALPDAAFVGGRKKVNGAMGSIKPQ